MTLYIGYREDQPEVSFTSNGHGISVAKGIGIVDLSLMNYTPGDWSRDDIEFTVVGGSSKWHGPPVASVAVYPITFDIASGAALTDIGWGIDRATIFNLRKGPGHFLADIAAKIVMKTSAAEVLRIGWQVTFGG